MKPDPNCIDHPDSIPIVTDSGNSTHYAALRCPVCDRFLKWVSQHDPRLRNLVFFPTKSA
jgi:hypothetical protein